MTSSEGKPESGTIENAFALSGGGSLGAIQVGMLQALYERGIRPDAVVGTSAGAINGAFIAGRPPTVATALELAELWRTLRRADIFPLQPVTGFLGFVGRRRALVEAQSLRRLVQKHIRFVNLEDAPIAFHVIATDLLSGQEVRLSQGDACKAVLASAAVPGVFPPVRWKERTLVDGGVCNNTPISHAVELGAKTIYVLPSGNACALSTPPRSALGVIMHSMSLLVMQRLILEIEMYRDSARLIVLPPPCPLGVQPVDFAQADHLIGRSRDDTHAYLDDLEAGRAEAPIRMSMHDHRR